jgi:hypothetical protein
MKMVNFIILATLTYSSFSRTEYKPGQCFYLVDPENGQGDERDILKIDTVTKSGYKYRWWVLESQWAYETNYRTSRKFENMVKPIQCPKG